MNQNLKLFLVAIICLVLGAGGFFSWNQYSQTQQENKQLREALTGTPSPNTVKASPEVKAGASSTPAVSPAPAAEKGSISGTLGYPSQGIPPLQVYAFLQGNPTTYFTLNTQTNQQNFTMTDVTPGTYLIVAYPKDTAALAGGYTKAVPCGLTVACTDHSLIPVVVKAGEEASGVEVKDWYAPEGQFPAKP